MKRLLITFISLCALVFSQASLAQAPELFNYQAVLRDMNNDVLPNQAVGIEISILQGSSSGTVVYAEAFNPTTNAFGLVNLSVGSGTVLIGDFSSIDWAIDRYFLRLAVDETGGTNYITLGTTQLLSVPYALHAKTAANAFSGNYNDLSGLPAFAVVATSGDYNDLTNRPSLSAVATSGDYDDLNNSPVLSAVATSGDFNDLQNIPSDLGGIPQHEWSGTSLRFENPDGSFGAFVDLKGEGGRTVLSGLIDPTTQGNDGDIYINTATSTLFGPKLAGSWPAGVSLVGATGPTGPAGAQGPQGIAGNQGPAGPTGVQGPQGEAGPAGAQGPAGIQGEVGPQGPQGIVGPTGAQGPAGIQGPQGDIGPAGPAGPIGPQGPMGNAGTSMLSGAADPTTEGNNGDFYINITTSTLFGPKTAGSWPAGISLVGAQGLQGPAGTTGPQGVAGPQGPQGIQGVTGITGPQGPQGVPGPQGPTGNAGTSILSGSGDPTSEGNDGDFYINTSTSILFGPKSAGTWPAGVSLLGAQGLQGPAGDTGPQGVAGPAGPQGLQGVAGATGPQGPQGIAGPQGPTGNAGTSMLSGSINPATEGNDGDFYINTSTSTLFGPKSAGAWPAGVSLIGAQGLTGPAGPQGLQGISGPQGPMGTVPGHEWSGTNLRFENPDGSFGAFVDLKGDTGDVGDSPEYQWSGTSIRFRNPDGSWGSYVNLKGEQGENIPRDAFVSCFHGPTSASCNCNGKQLQHQFTTKINESCFVQVSEDVKCSKTTLDAYNNTLRRDVFISSAHCCVCL